MAMLCKAMQTHSSVKLTGLCHSVQGTAKMLARWIGAEDRDITYLCAGINHQAWYLEYTWKGADGYPLIRRAIEENKKIYDEEQVRNEMYLHLDYYVTESSGHNSEYSAWFRKRPELVEKYCTHGTGWNPGEYAYIVNTYTTREKTWREDIRKELSEPVNLERGHEYASSIFNAIFGDGEMFTFNGNVRNFGLIDNLPRGSCVEVPILASPIGLQPIHVGPLPAHLAIMNQTHARCEDLAVEAAVEGDPRKVFHAVAMDPLTSAVLDLEGIKTMVDEMLAYNREWLPRFTSLR